MASCSCAIVFNYSAISSSASNKFGDYNASLTPSVKKNVKALPQIPKLRDVGHVIKEASIKIIDAVADFTFEFVDQKWLPSQRNFAPVDEIDEAIPVVAVKGCIPDDFPEGVYIRNGSQPLSVITPSFICTVTHPNFHTPYLYKAMILLSISLK